MILSYTLPAFLSTFMPFLETEAGSLIERISGAVGNTIIGMATVFIILIFMSFVISQMKIIPKLEEKYRKKETKEEIAPAVPQITETEEEELEEELTDDTELVAVITGAIMAYMGNEVPADGLVVRSIRKHR